MTSKQELINEIGNAQNAAKAKYSAAELRAYPIWMLKGILEEINGALPND